MLKLIDKDNISDYHDKHGTFTFVYYRVNYLIRFNTNKISKREMSTRIALEFVYDSL